MDFHMNNTSSSPSEDDSVVGTPHESPIPNSAGNAGVPAVPPLRMTMLDSAAKPNPTQHLTTSAQGMYDSNDDSIHTETEGDEEEEGEDVAADTTQDTAPSAAAQREEEEEDALAAQMEDTVMTEDAMAAEDTTDVERAPPVEHEGKEPCFLADDEDDKENDGDIDTPEERIGAPVENEEIVWKSAAALPHIKENNIPSRSSSSSASRGSHPQEQEKLVVPSAAPPDGPRIVRREEENDAPLRGGSSAAASSSSSSSSSVHVDDKQQEETAPVAPPAVVASTSAKEKKSVARHPPPLQEKKPARVEPRARHLTVSAAQKQKEPPTTTVDTAPRTRSRNVEPERPRKKESAPPPPPQQQLQQQKQPRNNNNNTVEGTSSKETVLMHLLKETLAMNELLELELQTTKAKLKHSDSRPSHEKRPHHKVPTPAAGETGPAYYTSQTTHSRPDPYEDTHRTGTSSAVADYNYLMRLVAPRINTPSKSPSQRRTEEVSANARPYYYYYTYEEEYDGDHGRGEEEAPHVADVRAKNAIRLRTVSAGNEQRRRTSTHRNVQNGRAPARSGSSHPIAQERQGRYAIARNPPPPPPPAPYEYATDTTAYPHNRYAQETYTYRTKKRTFSRPAAPQQPCPPPPATAYQYTQDSRRPQERGRSAGPRMAPRDDNPYAYGHHRHPCQCEHPVVVNRSQPQQQQHHQGRHPGAPRTASAPRAQGADLREVERSYLEQCRSVLEQLERMVGQDKS